MTQFAIILDGKEKARIFTDTKAGNKLGLVEYCYKVDHLKKSRLAITGRGFIPTSDYIVQYAKEMDLGGFDDYLSHWPHILKKAMRSVLVMGINKFRDPVGNAEDQMLLKYFQNASWDKIAEFLKRTSIAKRAKNLPPQLAWTKFEHELFVVGFSEKQKTMGFALCASYDDFKIRELYKTGDSFFTHTDKVVIYFKGRAPKTDKDMVTGMRVSHLYDVANHNDQRLGPETKIKKTTVYADGRFSVKNMGPFLKKNGKI